MPRKNKQIPTLENLEFASYEENKAKIIKIVGELPPLPNNLPQGNWTEQALKVLEERYLQKNEKGEVVETPEDMCWRVSWEIASAEALWGQTKREVVAHAKEYYKLLVSREFLPNSPTLMNAGTGNMLQFSACFVLPVEDSIEGIFDALKYQALIHKSGGGTGFSFSRLRPKGSMVRSSSGTASGPVSFMRIFDAATNEVKQGGKRRGANMGILRVDHPDIEEFIHCKDTGDITNFNISVAITNDFIEAYKNDENYDLIDPRTKKVAGSLSARKIFDEIAESAWKTGDPGLVFLDKMNEGAANPVPALGPVESTNPCGEQPLYPFDSCNLGSIFLSYFVTEKKEGRDVDWDKLKKVTRQAVRFMDNVIEMNPYPLDQIRRTSLAIRRIGLGVGGWADLLIDLGIAYDSREALNLGEKVMQVIQKEAVAESEKLARERGAFPLWEISIYKNDKPRRNSTVTTIAPTGTISIIAGTSSGIEPIFAIAYQHIVKDKHLERTLTFVNPKFKEIAQKQGFWNAELERKIGEHGTVRDIAEVPDEVRRVFGTAHEIHHDWHIKMQAAFQKYTENAVSKTINMRNSVTDKDIKDAYLLAWENNCKGITVFRDGCKDAQVLNMGIKNDQKPKQEAEENYEPTLERPLKVTGATYKMNTPMGNAFITINENAQGEPIEIFINVGKAGSDITAVAEALGRTVSTALRFRGALTPRERAIEIAKQLSGIGGRRSVGFGANRIRSLPDAVAVAISTHLNLKEDVGEIPVDNGHTQKNGHTNGFSKQEPLLEVSAAQENMFLQESVVKADICPNCGASALVYEEGCSKCYVCGHSEC